MWRESSETVAKLARFVCGRAIKPVRPPIGTNDLFKRQIIPIAVFATGLIARRHMCSDKYLSRSTGERRVLQRSHQTRGSSLRHFAGRPISPV